MQHTTPSLAGAETLAAAMQALRSGLFAASLDGFDRALRSKPECPEAWTNRAIALRALGRLDEALASCDMALRQKPGFADALANRGAVLQACGRHAEALACLDAALAARAAGAIHLNRGVVLRQLGRLDEALAAADAAIAQNPVYPEAWSNRGVVLRELGRLEEAAAAFETALAQKPLNPETWSNLGCVLQELGRADAAMTSFTRALAQKPGDPDTRFHRGMLLLRQGDFETGWPDYECRWLRRKPEPSLIRGHWPTWAGEPLAGRTLVVHSEQGLGDSLQFARYLPLLRGPDRRVVFVTHAKMHAVLSAALDGIDARETFEAGEAADFHAPLMSLPHILRTRADTIPARIPYLRADPARVALWRARLGGHGFRIGIFWHGNKQGRSDRRAVPLAAFAPIARLPGVRLISLQKTHGLAASDTPPPGLRVETPGDFDEGADAFVDTAAAMMSLDLVIGSDTSGIHLAGALGRPVFVALRHVAEWRWLTDRETSPWYPTLKIFRQTRDGDWDNVFEDIARDVGRLHAASIAQACP